MKTLLSSSFISTGVVLAGNGLVNNNVLSILIGFLFIIIAVFVVIVIDKWKVKKEHEKIRIIDEHLKEQRDIIKNDINEEAMEIAKSLVEKELENLKKE